MVRTQINMSGISYLCFPPICVSWFGEYRSLFVCFNLVMYHEILLLLVQAKYFDQPCKAHDL